MAIGAAMRVLPEPFYGAARDHFGFTDTATDEKAIGKVERERLAAYHLGRTTHRWYYQSGRSADYQGRTPSEYVIALVTYALCGIADPVAYIAKHEEAGLASPSATMVSRDPDHLEVFWVGPNNEVFYRWWLEPQGWSSVESWAEPEAVYLAAVSRGPEDQILFGLAPDGRVWYRVWEIDDRGWHVAGTVHWLNGVVCGPLAAASRGADMIELFAFDIHGKPRHRWTEGGMQWSPWTSNW